MLQVVHCGSSALLYCRPLLLLLFWGAAPDCMWLRLCGVQHHWLLLLVLRSPAWDSMGLGLCAVQACCAVLLLLL